MKNGDRQRIFFVDDEPNVRQAISETLDESEFDVSCFACSAECLEQLRIQRCDLLITDLKLPAMGGIELLRRGRRLTPWLPVLIVTGYGDIRTAVEAIKAGAVDFIEKPLAKRNFVEKIKSILQENGNPKHLDKPLTESEIRVVKLVMEGKSNKEIANLLNRSPRTIEVHRAHAMRKLGVDNLIDLVRRVTEMGSFGLRTSQGCATSGFVL